MGNNVLIIAGMHRSGTSLITQWLHQCGLHVGDKLLGKGIGNDDGHFEDMEFYEFHQMLLKSKNLPVSGFVENPISGMTEKDKSVAIKLIEKKNKQSEEWGWKDPRTCLFLPDYNEMIPHARYMVIYRDFRSTVSSLVMRTHKVINYSADDDQHRGFLSRFWQKRAKRKEIDELCRHYATSFLSVWILYNKQIIDFLNTIPEDKFQVLNYESLLSNDKKVFSRVQNDWNFSLKYVSFLDVYKPTMISKKLDIRRFVDKDLFQDAWRIEACFMKKSL